MIALIIIIIIIVGAVLLYLILRARAAAATAASNTSAGVGCTSSIQCSAPNSACNISTGRCVQCTAADSVACTGSTPHCRTSTNTCVRCNIDTHCPACQTCVNNLCQATTPAAPVVTDAHYVGADTLSVTWTSTPGATNYLIDYIDAANPTPKCINSMCQINTSSTGTTYVVPPGQAACAPCAGSQVFVTAVTPCGNIVSPGYLLNGQCC